MVAYLAALQAEKLDTVGERSIPSATEEEAWIRSHAENDRSGIFVAEANGTVVGLLDVRGGARPHNQHTAAFGMSVAKAWRGRGIGRMLLEAAIDRCTSWEGFCRLELEVVPWNTPAIALYESMGFEIEARRAKAAKLRGDEPHDMLSMRRLW